MSKPTLARGHLPLKSYAGNSHQAFIGGQAQHLSNTAGDQATTYSNGIEVGFVLLAHLISLMFTVSKVSIDFGLMPQVTANNRVHVRQLKRGVLLHDLFRGRSFAEGSNDRVKGDTRRVDAHRTILSGHKRDGFGFNDKRHSLYLLFS